MNGKELIKILKENGWILDRINGSHQFLLRMEKELFQFRFTVQKNYLKV
jgi:predicted RNA binding protein YcfA (HicA-like mRNA interferase family)